MNVVSEESDAKRSELSHGALRLAWGAMWLATTLQAQALRAGEADKLGGAWCSLMLYNQWLTTIRAGTDRPFFLVELIFP